MAGRPKKEMVKEVNKELPLIEKEIYKCPSCGTKYKDQEKNFYKSSSILIRGNNNRMVICKKCIIDLYSYLVDKYEDTKIALYFLCRLTDTYFDANLYPSVAQQATNSNSNISGIYFQKINSLPQYMSKTFFDSTHIETDSNNNVFKINASKNSEDLSESDIRNKDDVIRMLGYNPFENENPLDNKYLFNTLVDFLDEATLEDSLKSIVVVEIVKSFNQIDKINQALALMTADISNVSSQVGGVKSLITAKKEIYSSILSMAKDNGISVNHNNNRSKGGNTLNGIVRKLNEIGMDAAEINLFDLQTCDAMKQIADLSNRSILDQLMLDENDYSDMIAQQNQMIQNLNTNLNKAEESNRLLKIELKKYKIETEVIDAVCSISKEGD